VPAAATDGRSLRRPLVGPC